MGVSQSVPAHRRVPSTEDEGESKHILPYGVSRNIRHLQLTSSYSTLYDGIVSLIQDNKYADLVIVCGNDRYPVHRAIVCPRSHFFEQCCAVAPGEMDQASPSRPAKIWIDPSECESQIVAAILTFLYTLDYAANGQQVLKFGLPQEVVEDNPKDSNNFPLSKLDISNDPSDEPSVLSDDDVESFASSAVDTPEAFSEASSRTATLPQDPSETPNELVFHSQMYVAGKRFGISSLCDIAKDKFAKRLRCGPWNEEMLACIREVYRHGDDPKLTILKEDMVRSARLRFKALKTRKEWEELVIDFPQFAAELLRRM